LSLSWKRSGSRFCLWKAFQSIVNGLPFIGRTSGSRPLHRCFVTCCYLRTIRRRPGDRRLKALRSHRDAHHAGAVHIPVGESTLLGASSQVARRHDGSGIVAWVNGR
jgi:hypothetical protein